MPKAARPHLAALGAACDAPTHRTAKASTSCAAVRGLGPDVLSLTIVRLGRCRPRGTHRPTPGTAARTRSQAAPETGLLYGVRWRASKGVPVPKHPWQRLLVRKAAIRLERELHQPRGHREL